jgi:hypothetical protein
MNDILPSGTWVNIKREHRPAECYKRGIIKSFEFTDTNGKNIYLVEFINPAVLMEFTEGAMTKIKFDCCPRFCSNRAFCPPGQCQHCDKKREQLERVPVEYAEENRDFYAVYFLTRRGVLRWLVSPQMNYNRQNRYRNLGALPTGKTYFMADVAVDYGRGKIDAQRMRLEAVR